MRDAVLDVPFRVPVNVALVLLATALEVTVKVPEVAPAAIVTEAGTCAEEELLVRATVRPPVGATDPRVAVPVAELDPVTLVGDTEIAVRTGGLMVNVAVAVPLNVPEIVAIVDEETAAVVTVNVAVLEPEATATLAGRVALELLLLRVTVLPPDGAATVSVTVPVDEDPPFTELGERVTVEIDCECAIVGTKIAAVAHSNSVSPRRTLQKIRLSIVNTPMATRKSALGAL